MKTINVLSPALSVPITPDDIPALLHRIGLRQADRSFNDSAPDDPDWRVVEGLGIAIAHWAEWDGVQIMRVFRAALEDANFHTEAGKVEDWITEEEKD
jgi:hypothetical protein